MSFFSQVSVNVGDAAQAAETGPSRSERGDRADPRVVEIVILSALVIGAAALYSVYALRIGSFQPDEWYYMELARVIAHHFPAGLWQEGIYWRGIQRIDQLVLAAPFAFLRGASVYEVGHIIQALLYASTAIPIWLLARAAGLRRWSRILAALLVLTAPWAIVSTSFLGESAAFPAYAWVLYTTWVAAREPSYRREAFAVAALAVAALSRTALIGLAPILPLAVLWQTWRWDLRGQKWRSRVIALPGQLWSRHRLVTSITALAVAVFAFNAAGLLPGGGLTSLTGSYGVPNFLQDLNGISGRYEYYLSRMVVGTGVVAFALGVAWALRGIARPRDGRLHALAAVCVLGMAVELLSLIQAGPDERYVLYGAAPIALAFAAEVESMACRTCVAGRWQRRGRTLSIMLGAAAAITLLAVVAWPPIQSEYDFFTYPAAAFYARVVLGRLSTLPLVHSDPSYSVYVAVAVLALVWAAMRGIRRIARPGAVLVAAITVGLCATELVYGMEKFTSTAAAVSDGSSASQRSWLERYVPSQARVAAVGIGLGATPEYEPIWRTAEFWNTAIRAGIAFQPWEVPTIPFNTLGMTAVVHSPSGRLSISTPTPAEVGHAVTIPHYLLLPRQATNPLGFAAKKVADAPVLPLELVHMTGAARLKWSLANTSLEGFMAPNKPATATVYDDALREAHRCLKLDLIGPPGFHGTWPYRILSGGRVATRGLLEEQQTTTIEVALRPRTVAGGQLATVVIIVHGQVPYTNGETVSAKIASVAVGSCRGAARQLSR